MALGLQLVSVFWFYKILKMFRYKIAKRTTTVDMAAKVSARQVNS